MRSRRVALYCRLLAAGVFISLASLALVFVAAATGGRARRLYARMVAAVARGVLGVWGVSVLRLGGLPASRRQVVYVSNHSSTIDLFALLALSLPDTRFFLGRALCRYWPVAILSRLLGTFLTAPQEQPEERRRIFASACETLRRTGESVYLSPEGGRIATGEIGPFNKGAFHLAASLGVPIVPLYFDIPPAIDPGLGFDAGAGTVRVFVMPAIDTREWRLEDLVTHKERVRARFVDWHRQSRENRHARQSDRPGSLATAAR